MEPETFTEKCRFESEILCSLVNDYDLTDVEFKIGKNGSISANKTIIYLKMPKIRELFDQNEELCKKNIIELNEIKHCETFKMLLDYCYSGLITITSENAPKVLYYANYLQMKEVESFASQVIKKNLNIDYILNAMQITKDIEFNGLNKSVKYFILSKFEQFIQHEDFLQINYIQLKYIISDNDLKIDNEEKVFEAIIKWVRHDEMKRKQHLLSLLKCVRLPLLPIDYLILKVSKNELIKASNDCRDLISEVIGSTRVVNLKDSIKELNFKKRESIDCKGLIYVISKTNSLMEAYNPEENTWTAVDVDAKNVPNFNFFNIAVVDNYLFTFGGRSHEDHVEYVKKFDHSTNNWIDFKPLKKPRSECAVSVINNKIYVFGGKCCIDNVEVYDPKIDEWQILENAEMTIGKYAHRAVNFQGDIYIAGGYNEENNELNCIQVFDTLRSTWYQIEPMQREGQPMKRYAFGMVTINEKIYVVGGKNETGFLQSGEVYDIFTEKWTEIANMNVKRSYFGLVAYSGKLYAIGGFNGGANNNVEVYDPSTNIWTIIENSCMNKINGNVEACIIRSD